MSYIGTQPVPQSLESRQEFTATASQTTFATNGYTVGYVDVYLNGVKLSTSDFTATNGSDVVLGSGATAGDVLAVVMKNDHSDLVALPITDSAGTNVLSESGGVVTLTADNIGVGTSLPTDPITIQANTGASAVRIIGRSAGDSSRIDFYNNANSSRQLAVYSDGGVSALISDSTIPLAFYTNGSERMRIDTSGNVGIGTGSSSLTNNLVIGFDDLGSGTIEFRSTTYAQVAKIVGSHDSGTAEGSLRFHTRTVGNEPERMRIDSSGRVGIGTTSPSYQLQLSTDSAGKPSTNTWTVVSDERIKEQIELADLDLCYDAVKNIPLKRFKWKDEVYSEEQVADRHKLGWIAQDVESVYPKAVNIHEFRYNQVYNETIIPAVEEELDEEGNVITEAQEERTEKELVSEDVIEDCRNLNADQIYAAMYGAIQKLIQKVESQQSQIDTLTTKTQEQDLTIASLISRIEALETPAE